MRGSSSTNIIVKRLEDACNTDLRAPGFPAEMTDSEPEELGAEAEVKCTQRKACGSL